LKTRPSRRLAAQTSAIAICAIAAGPLAGQAQPVDYASYTTEIPGEACMLDWTPDPAELLVALGPGVNVLTVHCAEHESGIYWAWAGAGEFEAAMEESAGLCQSRSEEDADQLGNATAPCAYFGMAAWAAPRPVVEPEPSEARPPLEMAGGGGGGGGGAAAEPERPAEAEAAPAGGGGDGASAGGGGGGAGAAADAGGGGGGAGAAADAGGGGGGAGAAADAGGGGGGGGKAVATRPSGGDKVVQADAPRGSGTSKDLPLDGAGTDDGDGDDSMFGDGAGSVTLADGSEMALQVVVPARLLAYSTGAADRDAAGFDQPDYRVIERDGEAYLAEGEGDRLDFAVVGENRFMLRLREGELAGHWLTATDDGLRFQQQPSAGSVFVIQRSFVGETAFQAFESEAFPGQFLRHEDFRLTLSEVTDASPSLAQHDATFMLEFDG
jgi:hypothetical protein